MSISVEKLSFAYREHPVLENVSFSVPDGRFMALLGKNGVGKSTLLRCMLGLLDGYTGTVKADGDDIRLLSPARRARRMAYIPQSHGHSFGYTALEMVLMGTTHRVSPLSAPGKRERADAAAAMERVGVFSLAERPFFELSGGEQQLVLIARAIAQDARTLIMDEPTSNLDYGNQATVLNTVCALADEGYSVILSTHNPQHALWYADDVLALLDGRVEAYGTPDSVMGSALLKKLYDVDTVFFDTPNGRLVAPVGKDRDHV